MKYKYYIALMVLFIMIFSRGLYAQTKDSIKAKSIEKPIAVSPLPLKEPIKVKQIQTSNKKSNKKTQSDFFIQPYHVGLKAQLKGWFFNISGTKTLQHHQDGSWVLTLSTHSFLLNMVETSYFRIDQNNEVTPLRYELRQSSIFGAPKNQVAVFDAQAKKIRWTLIKKKEKHCLVTPWQKGMLDNLSYQVALRLDLAQKKKNMHYSIAKPDGIHQLAFHVVGLEAFKNVKNKKIISIKVATPKETKKNTYIWFTAQSPFNFLKILHQSKSVILTISVNNKY